MTTEAIQNCVTDTEDIERVKDFGHLVSVISSNGDESQEIKRWLRLGRQQWKNWGRLPRAKMCH